MKKDEIIISRCGGIHREITVQEVRETINERLTKDTDFWNLLWMTLKLLFPNKIELYQRPHQFLIVVDYDKEGDNDDKENIRMLLGYINHLTLVKCFAIRTDEGKLVFTAS